MNETRTRTRVAIYCRVSTDFAASLKSLENQILAYLDLVQEHPGWLLQGVYSDRGLSGTGMARRKAFQRLLRHCEEGRIDLVLTKSISRFSRNTHDFLGVLRRLRALRIDVVFEKEGIRMSEADNEFMLTLYGAMAQQESVNTSENIAWAWRRRALAGKPKLRRLYGYAVEGRGSDRRLVVVPAEADVVRRIFEWFAEGRSVASIIRQLAADGVRTLHGQPAWTPKGIRRLLENVKYTGNARIVKKPSRLSHLQIDMSEAQDEILVRASHPAIVSEALFERTARILADRQKPRRAPAKPSYTYALQGRMRCGFCGANYALHRRGKDDLLSFWDGAPIGSFAPDAFGHIPSLRTRR